MTTNERQIADSLLSEISKCDPSCKGIAIQNYSSFLDACQTRQTLTEPPAPELLNSAPSKPDDGQVPLPLMPEGWRLLAPPEVLTHGDMFANYPVRDKGSVYLRDWTRTVLIGKSVCAARTSMRRLYIRQVISEYPVPAGWRLLVRNEPIQVGDYHIRCQLKEVGSTNLADWYASFCPGKNAEQAAGDVNHPYIRKI